MKKFIILLSFLCLPSLLWASEWQLDPQSSDIQFISIKKNKIAETHHFTRIKGAIKQHRARVVIDLASVETGIPIRNSRMKSMLFNVADFPKAVIQAKIAKKTVSHLRAGEIKSISLPITLKLHGITKAFEIHADVIKLAHKRVLVISKTPIIVRASDFGLQDGIEALRAIAKLPSIAYAVPVSFHLLFHKQ